MGAIAAILAEPGNSTVEEAVGRAAACSPYRGAAASYADAGLGFALGVQSCFGESSIATTRRWIVGFTGFVGNWPELRRELDLVIPVSVSDADAISIAFERLGKDIFRRLRGEFAVVMFDRENRTLIAVRDVVGARPLYFFGDRRCFVVASEIRQVQSCAQLTSKLDVDHVVGYLYPRVRGFNPGNTEHRGVSRVTPGTLTRFENTGRRPHSTEAYWEPPPQDGFKGATDSELAVELRSRLEAAVDRATPRHSACVALSGGVDSGIVWALINRLSERFQGYAPEVNAVSFLYPGMTCDETQQVKDVIRLHPGSWTGVDLSEVSPMDDLQALASELDVFFGVTIYQVEHLTRMVDEDSRRSVVTGLGGDEWFMGSFGYLGDYLRAGRVGACLVDAIRAKPYVPVGSSRLDYLRRALRIPRVRLFRREHTGLSTLVRASALQGILDRDRDVLEQRLSPPGMSTGRRVLDLSLRRYHQGNILEPLEQCFARHGSEIRSPFNDLDLIEFAFGLPDRAPTGGRRHKHLVLEAAGNLLPHSVRKRRHRVSYDQVATAAAVAAINSIVTCKNNFEWALVDLEIVDGEKLDTWLTGLYHAKQKQFPFGSRKASGALNEKRRLMRDLAVFYHLYSLEIFIRKFNQ